MKIAKIQVDGFGALRDREYEMNAPITLFYGRNEAGKSTLMGFIRAMLFGFPTRQSLSERYEPAGGAYGGALTLVDDQGKLVRVERHGGAVGGTGPWAGFTDNAAGASAARRARSASGGIVRVFPAGEAPGGDARLAALLGGLSAEVFRSLFAFGLGELQEIRSLQSDEIGAYLYSAGMGAGGSVIRAERSLVQEMDQLFKPRGSNQELNKLLKTIEQLELELRKSKEQAGMYNGWQEQIKQLDERILAMDEETVSVRNKLAWADKCIRAREHWIMKLEIQRELLELPDLSFFPEDAVDRLDALNGEHEQLTVRQAARERRIAQFQEERSALGAQNTALINAKPQLNDMAERIGAYREAIKAKAELLIEIQHSDSELRHILRQIDPGWTLETLHKFPVTIAVKEQIRAYRQRLSASLEEADRLKTEFSRLISQETMEEHALDTIKDQIMAFEANRIQHFHNLNPESIEDLTSSHGYLKSALDQIKQLQMSWEQLHVREEDLQRQAEMLAGSGLNRALEAEKRLQLLEMTEKSRLKQTIKYYNVLFRCGAALNLLMPLTLLYLSRSSFAIAVFAALLVLNVYFFIRINSFKGMIKGKSQQHDSEGSQAMNTHHPKSLSLEQDRQQLERQIREQLRGLDWHIAQNLQWDEAAVTRLTPNNDSITKPELDRFLIPFQKLSDELGQFIDSCMLDEIELKRLEEKWSDQKKRLLSLQSQHKEYEAELERGKAASLSLNIEWDSWLSNHDLPPGLSADAVLDICRLAEHGHQLMQSKDQQQFKLEQHVLLTDSFEQQVNAFAANLDRRMEQSANPDPVYLLKQWLEEAEHQIRMEEQSRRISNQIQEMVEEQLEDGLQLETITRKIQALYLEANALDGQQLRQRSRLFHMGLKLEEELRHIDIVMETWVGAAEVQRLTDSLTHNDLELLQSQSEQLTLQLNKLEGDANDLKDERGRLRNESDRLLSGKEHSDKLQQLEEHIALFQQQAKQWAALSICSRLIGAARKVYEREKQPGVLLRASEYLAIITGGQFVRVMAPFGEKRLMAERGNGQMVETSYLSRGTAEQLYLSMRFALADEYAEQTALPLVMDDIFVNFDLERLTNTLKVLDKVSERHQILLFTCHHHVYKAVAEMIPDYQLIKLDE